MGEPYITFSSTEVAAYYAAKVPHLKQRGREWRGPCPVHHGQDDNFAVIPASGVWFCHSTCGRGGDILDLEAVLNSGDFSVRKAAVFALMGRAEPEYRHQLTSTNGNSEGKATASSASANERGDQWRQIEAYPYTDGHGNLLFQVVRFERGEGAHRQKKFRQRQPDRRGGWNWDLYAIERVPYHLEAILKADVVYLVEGEKDVHTLECNGSLSLHPTFARELQSNFSSSVPARNDLRLMERLTEGIGYSFV